LREAGTMRGWVFPADMDVERAKRMAHTVEMRDEVFRSVAPAEPVLYDGGTQKVLLVDVGAKDNIVRSLLERGVSVIRAPWHARLEPLARECDGVMLGNGPGDPKDLAPLVEQVRALLGSYPRPIFGICLGNQILALAAGGDTYKLPYGHRGVNQPVQDLLTRRSYVTSQNHGYSIGERTLVGTDLKPWFINADDRSIEGVVHQKKPCIAVQFHPEATPGPYDTEFVFDKFASFIRDPGRKKATATTAGERVRSMR